MKCQCNSFSPDVYETYFPTWTLFGAALSNTDECILYARVHTRRLTPSGLMISVFIYKSFVSGLLVATGGVTTTGVVPWSGTITFSQVSGSGLSGSVTAVDIPWLDIDFDMTLSCSDDRSSSSSSSSIP